MIEKYCLKYCKILGSPLGPALPNIFMSQFDGRLSEGTKLYRRYVDDCLIVDGAPTSKLEVANKLNPANLSFTLELESKDESDSVGDPGNMRFSLPFLDILATRDAHAISTGWYRKPTDTGLVLSAMALAPRSFKRGMVLGTFHRIYNASSTWNLFHEGVNRFRETLRANGYSDADVDKWLTEF